MACNMLGIASSSLARSSCYLRGVRGSIYRETRIFSTQFLPCRFGYRTYSVCSNSSDKYESSIDGNKLISDLTDCRITVRTNDYFRNITNIPTQVSENIASSELDDGCLTAQQGISQHTEFLGIEVFPEIFDKLPPKCTGCGAILQSQNENRPGYIPEKRNPSLSRNSEENSFMAEKICSRCFSLKHYNKDVPPMISPETISKFLTHISRRKALILYIVDIMNVPGSFAEDILKIVGETKHIILVGNKIDRLPVDGHPSHQIQHLKRILSDEGRKFGLQNANIQEVSVISAKTGFGILSLVRTINKHWGKNSDVYLVGCNNSGKTTLFNLLVDLFSASRHSDNMLQRGTVSESAGTTLSLLRYPITKHRFLRLQDRLKTGYLEMKSKENQQEVDLSGDIIEKQSTKYRDIKEPAENVSKALSPYQLQFVTRQKDHLQDELSWLYDTPGLYSKNQITHLLSNQELKLLNPTSWFVPRTVILRPGKVLFVGGLARLDYLNVKRMSTVDPSKEDEIPKASQSIFFTIFASPNLPIHVTSLESADGVYSEHAGGDLLKVPCGGKTRMEELPELSGRVFEMTGVHWKRSVADVMLSNVGWVAVTAGSGLVVTLKAYTPSGAGLYLREPSLLPTSVRQRGRRGVPYLGHVNHSLYQGTRKRSPALAKYFTDENVGATQWMAVAKKKRKQQRAMLKYEKTSYNSRLRLGFSARSNPARYLPDYDDEGMLESGSRERIEDSVVGRKE
ncbi:nitric oxide-associated protein 1-like [Dendronephthya gigantea]|uniref:nitric oxide-associated protein 1-like n=1 Tax=Dendronephthya gigantea TaxID=151771 RepID=UPI00106DB8E0|nr:nitric oxide-associated protein 1-like [Dendronephthya gigantea]